MERIGSLALGVAISLACATPAVAQTTNQTDRDRVEQQLNSQRAATKAAYHSKDPKRIAAQWAKLRSS